MRMKKTGILAGIMATCICIAQSVPAFGAQQDLVGFVQIGRTRLNSSHA